MPKSLGGGSRSGRSFQTEGNEQGNVGKKSHGMCIWKAQWLGVAGFCGRGWCNEVVELGRGQSMGNLEAYKGFRTLFCR